ncbi:MAG: response regulator [Bacteroidia bacterium]|nr:response regulator [Bacteroidia bacterium]
MKAILCVDDEKIVLDSLLNQLMDAFGDEYLYEVAESVDEAWEVIDYLNEQGIIMVLVITDWLMPSVKGDTFLVDLHKKYPNTTKIMLTGQAEESSIRNAFNNANLYAFIKKPWDSKELIQKISNALNS